MPKLSYASLPRPVEFLRLASSSMILPTEGFRGFACAWVGGWGRAVCVVGARYRREEAG